MPRQQDSTLDISGYLQVSKDSFAPRSNVWYAELHGTMLYYWSEKPKDASTKPVSVFNVADAKLTDDPGNKLGVILNGPHLARQVTLIFAAERERNEWLEKLRHPVAGHTKEMAVEQAQAEPERQNQGDKGRGTKPHKICLDDFEFIRVLGEGAFGRVLQVKKKATGEQLAMKIMDKKLMENSAVAMPIERVIMERLRHPFVVDLTGSFQTDCSMYIVMKLLSGGELFYHLEQEGTFTEERARFYTAEIGLAIGYLQSNDIIYRDLKPENVVLDGEGHACLTDFGLAKENIGKGATANTFCGTAEYQAPEFLLGEPHGRAVDWWSLGIMLYEMLFGIPPFYDENTTTMSELILQGDLTFDKNGMSASPEAQDLIRRLLDRNTTTRMQTVEEFKKHPFFADIDFDKLYGREIKPPFIPDPDTSNNFNTDFTDQPLPVEEENTSGRVHPNIAGFTYERSDDATPSQQPAQQQEQQQQRPHATSHTSSAGGQRTGSSTKNTSATSSPKHKPSSPTGRKGSAPALHLVAKMAPKRPSHKEL